MAEQEELRSTASPAPVSVRAKTERAVNSARVLHHECTKLLQLYKNRETFLLDHTPAGERMVSLSPESEEPSTEEQVQLLHSALRQCLGLLNCVIQREKDEWGKLEDDYEDLKITVRARIEHLLHSTRDLLGGEDSALEVTAEDHDCTEEVDGGAFALKMWTYRVLLELIHWADHATKTLHVLHTERGGSEAV